MLRLSRVIAGRALMLSCAASLWLLPATAAAQERDPAAAQALFDQAKELMRQKKFAEACPKLQESNRLDPGIGTQFHLADCYEQSGRVASAWALFLDVASQARASGQLDREKAAQKRAEKIEPRLPKLAITVPESSKTAGLEIRRNGMLVGAAQWGTPVPVDPGEVELAASAPGKQTLRQTLRLEEGKTASYSLPALAAGGGAAPVEPAPTPQSATAADTPAAAPVMTPASPPASSAQPADAAPSKGSSNNGLVLTLAGVGVVGLGVGTTFAIMAKGQYDDSLAGCAADDVNRCNHSGVEQRNAAITKGNVATIATIAGGAALAGAGVVWLLSSGSSEKRTAHRAGLITATPTIGPRQATLQLSGDF
jgi:hypothetical protein